MSPWLSMPGAFIGALFALGIYLVLRGMPIARGINLSARVEPYLDRAPRRSRLLYQEHREVRFGEVVNPITASLAARLDKLLGGTESVRSRLLRANANEDVEGFRVQQVI